MLLQILARAPWCVLAGSRQALNSQVETQVTLIFLLLPSLGLPVPGGGSDRAPEEPGRAGEKSDAGKQG